MSDTSAISLQRDTLKEIQRQAVDAAGAKDKVQIVALPDRERGERYLLVKPDGASEVRQVPPQVRAHKLHALDQLPAYLDYAIKTLSAKPVVWYAEDGVRVVLDDTPESFRSDRVELAFEETPEFTWLRESAEDGSQVLDQKQLVMLLRTKLSACMTQSSAELLKVARKLTATTGTRASGTVESHRESLGRDIEQAVRSDAGEIPEIVEFRTRVLTDPVMRYECLVKCMIEIDPRTLAIQLFPRPEDIRTALEETLNHVGEYLDQNCASDQCQVFFGQPQ